MRPDVKDQIRILLLEDSPTDEEFVRRALRSGGVSFEMKRVETKHAFLDRLARCTPDLILSDFSLPTFDGMQALALAREKYPDIPFIFVTGTMGEEVAIETLKEGATDYVLKQRLSRLVPSVHRALREARVHAERKRAQEQLRESHKQLRALSVYLQDVREEERTRIAREVHDELGQALTGLKLQLTWMISRLPKDSRELRDNAKAMLRHIDETIQTIRRIATELRPGILDTGLLAALEWQAREFSKRTGIRCHVHTRLKNTEWDQELNTAFFRILQETLTNVIRHANASQVDIWLEENSAEILMEVTDNGRGISAAQIRDFKSLGLLGMRERAALLGGEVQWEGKPGEGTTVTVRIPRRTGPVAKPRAGR